MITKILKKEEGMITIMLALFATFFVTLFAVAMWELMTTDLEIITNHTRSMQSLYIADAGIEDAIYNLRQDKNWNTGFTDKTFPLGSGSTYTVAVVDAPYGNTLTSIGKIANFERKIVSYVLVSGLSTPYRVKIVSWREEQ